MATHEDFGRAIEVQGPSDRSFAITLAVVFAVIALLPLVHGKPIRLWAIGIGAALLTVGLLRPSILHALNRLWMRFGLFLSRLMTPVMMAGLFYLVITPIGFVRRLLGHDSLQLHFDRERTSYWIERKPPGPAPGTMSQQF